ncbi:MAG TPA: phosphate ABC transporter substrate-binding protein [Permianibacter sp.]|nr:phosphate ABC transporter substrate-binding protein [Permianibacter sp.]
MTLRMLCLTLCCLLTTVAQAEVAVIVNPGNGASLSSEDVQRLFLGKLKSFPGGGEATPVNQKEGQPAREQFNQAVLNKSESQLKAYWSQLVFTGKGTPPKELDNDDAIKALVASTPGAIGYIDAAKVDGSVKVVLKQ